VNNTGTKYVGIMKQTAFRREKTEMAVSEDTTLISTPTNAHT